MPLPTNRLTSCPPCLSPHSTFCPPLLSLAGFRSAKSAGSAERSKRKSDFGNRTRRKERVQRWAGTSAKIMYAVQLYPTTCMAKRALPPLSGGSYIVLSSVSVPGGNSQPLIPALPDAFVARAHICTLADLAPPAVPMGVPFSSSIQCTITSIVIYLPAHMPK